MPGSPLVDEHESHSPSSNISIWLENHPDHPEEYFCEIQPTLYQAESEMSPASPLRSPVPAAKRRTLVELSSHSMNAHPQRPVERLLAKMLEKPNLIDRQLRKKSTKMRRRLRRGESHHQRPQPRQPVLSFSIKIRPQNLHPQ
jgi:hypothetical protein